MRATGPDLVQLVEVRPLVPRPAAAVDSDLDACEELAGCGVVPCGAEGRPPAEEGPVRRGPEPRVSHAINAITTFGDETHGYVGSGIKGSRDLIGYVT